MTNNKQLENILIFGNVRIHGWYGFCDRVVKVMEPHLFLCWVAQVQTPADSYK